MEYMIVFYENYTDESFSASKGSAIKVSEREMFQWIEKAVNEGDELSIAVFRAEMVLDLS